MSFPIALLKDDFVNNTQDPPWNSSFVTGSATKAETSGQARLTLPSSTAGSHSAYYRSSAAYDLTGDGFYINIDTMVATGVAATATFDIYLDGSNILRWQQLSNTITSRKVVAGVDTQLSTAAWSSSTYKYLRIRESGGTIFFDSSTNGTSWTNRASIVGLPFAVTALTVQFGASCGNVASPGSLRIEDVNLILPAPSATWRETTADWGIVNRFMPITLASAGGKQGVLVTADTLNETTRALGGTVRYFAGPLGSTSGGFLQLTEYASLVLAQASPFPIPVSGRVDLPALVDARYMRLYHQSTDASAHNIYEFIPQRLVQAEMIQAESIQTINLAADSVTADKIFVLDLSAITATIGQLTIASSAGLNAWIYQGTGTGDSPTTGLKIYNSGGIGKLSTYNAGVEQVTLDTDGILKAGAGDVQLSASGIYIIAGTSNLYNAQRSYGFVDTLGGNRVADIYDLEGPSAHELNVRLFSKASRDSQMYLRSDAPTAKVAFVRLQAAVNNVVGAQLNISSGGGSPGVSVDVGDFSVIAGDIIAFNDASIAGGINVGTAAGAGAGDVVASGTIIPLATDAATTTQSAAITMYHRSSGTPGVGFGADVTTIFHSSTNTDRAAQTTRTTWATATDASRKARTDFFIHDTGARLALRLEASGAAAMIGFLGASAIARPTVSGSRGGNAALASALTALANLGLIVDSSS